MMCFLDSPLSVSALQGEKRSITEEEFSEMALGLSPFLSNSVKERVSVLDVSV